MMNDLTNDQKYDVLKRLLEYYTNKKIRLSLCSIKYGMLEDSLLTYEEERFITDLIYRSYTRGSQMLFPELRSEPASVQREARRNWIIEKMNQYKLPEKWAIKGSEEFKKFLNLRKDIIRTTYDGSGPFCFYQYDTVRNRMRSKRMLPRESRFVTLQDLEEMYPLKTEDNSMVKEVKTIYYKCTHKVPNFNVGDIVCSSVDKVHNFTQKKDFDKFNLEEFKDIFIKIEVEDITVSKNGITYKGVFFSNVNIDQLTCIFSGFHIVLIFENFTITKDVFDNILLSVDLLRKFES